MPKLVETKDDRLKGAAVVDWVGDSLARNGLRAPVFKAIDQLRIALDAAIELGDDTVADLLLIAIHDLADTIDVVDGHSDGASELDWSVSEQTDTE